MSPFLLGFEDLEISRAQRVRLLLVGLAIAVIVGLASFFAGKYSAPSTILEKTAEHHDLAATSTSSAAAVTSTSSSTAIAVDHSTVTTKHPDGTTSTEHRDLTIRFASIDHLASYASSHAAAVEKHDDVVHEKATSSARPGYRLELQLGLATRDPALPIGAVTGNPAIARLPLVARASASRRLVGPVWGSLWVDSSVAAGVGVAAEF